MQILIQNAHSGKDISYYNSSEQEVLYPRNSRFQVKSIREDEGKTYIVLEDMGHE